MKVYIKCQYCHHAIGARISIDRSTSWQTLGRDYRHEIPYRYEIERGAPIIAYHEECKEIYDSWSRVVFDHKWYCHLESCPHSHPYPFHRFNLPFNFSPTTLGDPIEPPEEVARLLRL